MMYYLFLIGVCVIMPIVVVWMNNRTSQNETNRKTEILLKSIEAGAQIDPEYFKPQKKENKVKSRSVNLHRSSGFVLHGRCFYAD